MREGEILSDYDREKNMERQRREKKIKERETSKRDLAPDLLVDPLQMCATPIISHSFHQLPTA